MTVGNWQPLLSGELAARAAAAVEAIVEAFARAPSPEAPGEGAWAGERLASLSAGAPGPALLFGYLARGGSAQAGRYEELAAAYLEAAVSTMAAVPMRVGLFSGFTGVAWAAEHLDRLLGHRGHPDHLGHPGHEAERGEPSPDEHDEVDDALLEKLAHAPWRGHFDLVTGLAGIGVYALERLPRRAAARCLEAVVEQLGEVAVSTREGITWPTRPELLPDHHRRQEPLGYCNLGVAHGVPGVVSLLADACRVEACAGRARHLLAGAVRWLLAQARPDQPGSWFGKWTSPRTGYLPARLAWCYGDPGVAATLLYAARGAGEAGWESAAVEIARHAARAEPELSGVADAALCHGAVGLAHLFNRVHQATGDETFADAARLWYGRGLDMRQPGEGIGGFCSWGAAQSPEARWPGDPGLLTGAAGIGLGLYAAISPLEPGWDRLLRLAIPPARLSPAPRPGACGPTPARWSWPRRAAPDRLPRRR
jgi:hypothetical protein